jgi:hypothetical protein
MHLADGQWLLSLAEHEQDHGSNGAHPKLRQNGECRLCTRPGLALRDLRCVSVQWVRGT